MLFQGIILGVVAALGQGLGAVVSRKAYAVVEHGGMTIDGLTAAYQRILGGLIFAALPTVWLMSRAGAPASETNMAQNPTPGAVQKLRKTWWWILLNSLAGPTLGVGCYQWGLQHSPSGVVLPIVATTPLVVVPLAYLFDGDRPGKRSLVGGVVAVAGVIGLTQAR
jgi:drug/metabolite transporter (DMT)-like permease